MWLLDSQDVGHGVEGGGFALEPLGGSQGAPDEGVATVGGVVEGDRFAQGAVDDVVDAGDVAGSDGVHADFALLAEGLFAVSGRCRWGRPS